MSEVEISKDLIKELREKSGAGMVDCKKALRETNGNVEEATNFLREKGLASAEKKGDRTASEGLMRVSFSADNKKAAMVEVNCETDFVAKTEDFQNFVQEIADLALAREATSAEELTNAKSEGDIPVQDWIKQKIATIGENIILRNCVLVQTGELGYITSYIHSNGKIGVLMELEAGQMATLENEALAKIANGLAMHTAAAGPKALDRHSLDQKTLEQEREIFRAQVLEEGKPENIVDKIVDGKMNKFYQQVCLLEQEYVVTDNKESVATVLDNVGKELGDIISIKQYFRFELG